jgi:hypothetical protein
VARLRVDTRKWAAARLAPKKYGDHMSHDVKGGTNINFVSPTHGEQEMSVWNGYACTCYHPLFVFNQFGDLERCALRAGNVHSADNWDDVLKPVVARYQRRRAGQSRCWRNAVERPL